MKIFLIVLGAGEHCGHLMDGDEAGVSCKGRGSPEPQWIVPLKPAAPSSTEKHGIWAHFIQRSRVCVTSAADLLRLHESSRGEPVKMQTPIQRDWGGAQDSAHLMGSQALGRLLLQDHTLRSEAQSTNVHLFLF